MAGMVEIEQAMRACQAPNMFLFFNFSGHGAAPLTRMQPLHWIRVLRVDFWCCAGTRVRDVSGDEADGMDEAL